MRKCALYVSMALAIVAVGRGRLTAQTDLEALAQRAAVRHGDVPRKVLAFYYPWYGNATVAEGSGRWSHWEQVDTAAKTIGSSTHYPLLGPYDSHDPKLIAQHCAWAKAAGVDGWIVSWWGKGDFTDRALGRILDACRQAGMEATIYYEVVPRPVEARSAARDLVDLLNRYGDHPAWLRVDGHPVVFIYGRAVGQLGLAAWAEALVEVNRQYPRKAVFLGDELSRGSAAVFDGIHTYNTAGMLRGKSPEEVRRWARARYPAWVRLADQAGRVSTITVIPGYDDTKIRKPGLKVERYDGALYAAEWEEAIAANPDWVLITSWNEWHEGSEIEPSAEFGRQYLEMTARFAAQFKGLPKKSKATAASGEASDALSDPRLKKLDGIAVGFLPGLESPGAWALLRLPIRPKLLTWDDVAAFQPEAARQYPLLVFAGGEEYRQTVREQGDVDRGLIRYLEGGGFLLVLPSGPMPFHFNEQGRAVESSRKFGLPLSVGGSAGGWERPPEGMELEFVQAPGRLPHVPERFPFPKEGDLRWRPLVRAWLDPGDLVVPLMELRDRRGTSYGDAAAYVEHKSTEPKNGRVLYAWFGLWQTPQADSLIADLLAFTAEQLKKE